jgi:xanthine/CO dehydrogenase XdhC/CoxF family maturation factor
MKEIRQIIQWVDELDRRAERAALVSVVRVEQSSYRRIGARMLVKSTGEWIGGISGGCLEGDALRRAQAAIFQDRSSIMVYDTLEEDEQQIGVGLGCNGRIEVLFTPLNPDDPDNPVEVLRRQLHRRTPNVLTQVIEREGAPPDGRLYEPEATGKLERALNLPAGSLGGSLKATWKARRSRVVALENKDGKRYTLLLEWVRPETRLIAAGQASDLLALNSIVQPLGWEIHVLGELRKFPRSLTDSVHSARAYEELENLQLDDFTAVLLMTHDYEKDLHLLRHFVPRRPRYLGLLGPSKRIQRMQEELPHDLAAYPGLFSPVGLDLGAETPEEIALAIAAEVLAAFRGRGGRPLKYRKGSIYERN